MELLILGILAITIIVMDHECGEEPEMKRIAIKKNVSIF